MDLSDYEVPEQIPAEVWTDPDKLAEMHDALSDMCGEIHGRIEEFVGETGSYYDSEIGETRVSGYANEEVVEEAYSIVSLAEEKIKEIAERLNDF